MHYLKIASDLMFFYSNFHYVLTVWEKTLSGCWRRVASGEVFERATGRRSISATGSTLQCTLIDITIKSYRMHVYETKGKINNSEKSEFCENGPLSQKSILKM